MSRSGVNGNVEQLDGAGETGTDVGYDMTRLEGSEEISRMSLLRSIAVRRASVQGAVVVKSVMEIWEVDRGPLDRCSFKLRHGPDLKGTVRTVRQDGSERTKSGGHLGRSITTMVDPFGEYLKRKEVGTRLFGTSDSGGAILGRKKESRDEVTWDGRFRWSDSGTNGKRRIRTL